MVVVDIDFRMQHLIMVLGGRGDFTLGHVTFERLNLRGRISKTQVFVYSDYTSINDQL